MPLRYNPIKILTFLMFFNPVTSSNAQQSVAINDCIKSQIEIKNQIKICQSIIQTQLEPNNSIPKVDILLKIMNLATRSGNFQLARDTELQVQQIGEQLNTTQRHRFLRRQGILDYRQGNLPQALIKFKQAKRQAQANADKNQLSKSLSDIGTANMAMMQYSEALSAFRESLSLKEKFATSKSVAVTLNNIGNVYRHLGDWSQAVNFYQRAIVIYQQNNDANKLAHSRENLALVYAKLNRNNEAIQLLEQSLEHFKKEQNQHASLRLLILLARQESDTNKLTKAENYLRAAEKIELLIGTSDQSTSLKLELGKLLSRQGHFQQANAMFHSGIEFAKSQKDKNNYLLLLNAATDNAVMFKQWKTAFSLQQKITQANADNFQNSFNESLAKIRGEFEFEQQQKEISLLSKDNKIQQLELVSRRVEAVALSLALVTLVLITVLASYWQWNKRRQIKSQLEAEINFHHQQFQQLGTSYNSLKSAFGQLEQAIMIVNNQQQIIFHNVAMQTLLQRGERQLNNTTIQEIIPLSNQRFWHFWNSDSDIESHHFKKIEVSIDSKPHTFNLQISTSDTDQSIVIFMLSPADTTQSPLLLAIKSEAEFHKQLVDLMLTSLETWEQATQSSRIELAEKSAIWRVSVDEGRLRTRSFDRYLSLKTLPKRPRWREVIRTAHFVLAECELDTEQKNQLSTKLEIVSQFLRQQALLN